MAEPADRARGSGVWSGVNVAYGSGVAAILLIAGGLFLYNHGFTSTDRLRPEESVFTLAADQSFAPKPDTAAHVRVWSPFRDLALTCETATWVDGDEHVLAAWCPFATLDRPYRRDDVHERLSGLIGLDAVEPDSHAMVTRSALSSAGRFMPVRSFFWRHTALRCFDIASFDLLPRGDLSVGTLAVAQLCLRGSDATVAARRDALLAGLAVQGADGIPLWPLRNDSLP